MTNKNSLLFILLGSSFHSSHCASPAAPEIFTTMKNEIAEVLYGLQLPYQAATEWFSKQPPLKKIDEKIIQPAGTIFLKILSDENNEQSTSPLKLPKSVNTRNLILLSAGLTGLIPSFDYRTTLHLIEKLVAHSLGEKNNNTTSVYQYLLVAGLTIGIGKGTSFLYNRWNKNPVQLDKVSLIDNLFLYSARRFMATQFFSTNPTTFMEKLVSKKIVTLLVGTPEMYRFSIKKNFKLLQWLLNFYKFVATKTRALYTKHSA